MAVKYTDQTLVIPADICKIIERSSLLDHGCDDFGLTFEIENGKVKVADLMEYVAKGYIAMEPDEAWDSVRKWWKKLQETNEVDFTISSKQNQIANLQSEIQELESSKRKWRIW